MSTEPQGIHVSKGPTGAWVPSEQSRYPVPEATGSSQKALRYLYRSLVGLCKVVQTMPGAKRPDLDYVAADLWEAGLVLGEVEGAFAMPISAWPEGEGHDDEDPDRPGDI